MPDEMNARRRLLQATIAGVGLLELRLSGLANAQSAGNTSHAKLRASHHSTLLARSTPERSASAMRKWDRATARS
jgi:hypothetical protein